MFFRLEGPPVEALESAPEYTSSIGAPLSSCGCTSPENPNSSATPGNAQDNAIGAVYLQTGELVQQAVDLSIEGVGFNWQFKRFYRSGWTQNGILGHGWTCTEERRLVVQPNGDVLRVDGNGRSDEYVLLTNDTFQSPTGFFTSLTNNLDGSFVEQDQHGNKTFYSVPDSFGIARLAQIIDRNGNKMTFFTNSMGQITNVLDTLGRSIAYQYNSNGRLAEVVDFTGRAVTFDYNGSGDLTAVTGPPVTGTPNTNDFPSGKGTLYTYNSSNQLLTVTAPNEAASGGPPRLVAQYASGRLASLILGGTNATRIPAGGTLSYSYTDLAQAMPGDVTTAVFLTTVTNRNNNVTQYQFNQLGNVLRMVQFTRGVRPSAPASYTTTFAYNLDGLLTQQVNPEGDSVQKTYDSTNLDRFQQGNLLQVLELPGPRGGDQTSIVISYTYEQPYNFILTSTDARGHVTTNMYDANGNCIHITQRIPSIVQDFTYNANGQMTSHRLPDNGSGYRRLDTMSYYTNEPQTGYLQNRVLDSGGLNITNHFDPDAVGNVTNSVDGLGNNSIFFVNSLNQVVRTLSRTVSTPSGSVRYQTDTFYDSNNNVTNVAVQNLDETGSVVASLPTINTSATYDILDDQTSQSQTADATHNVTTTNAFDADQNGILAAFGEAVNGDQPDNVVQTLFDERDLIFEQIRAPNDSGHSTVQFAYDGNRGLTNVVQGIEDTVAPRVTSYTRDGYNRPTSVLDAMGDLHTIHYDPNANVVSNLVNGGLVEDVPGSSLNVRLSQTAFRYDAMDRLVTNDQAFFDETTQAPIGSGHAITRTVYSDNSQVLTNFDANTNATVTVYDTAARPSVVVDAKGNTRTNIYDPNNNLVRTVEVDISDSGQPAQTFTTVFSYDGIDRLFQIIDNLGYTTMYEFDSRNDPTVYTDARGNLHRFGYDGLDRLLFTEHYLTSTGVGSGTVTSTVLLQKTWDADSRLDSQTDNHGNTTTYLYDSLSRPTKTLYADGTSTSNTYDVHNDVISTMDPNQTVVVNQYDLLNRVTNRDIAPGVYASPTTTNEVFRWDGLSRLVFASNTLTSISLAYDSLGDILSDTQQHSPAHQIVVTYDAMSNPTQLVYPNGRTISNEFDSLNRKASVFDLTAGVLLATNKYIGKWRLEERTLANGIALSLYYDGLRRISSMVYSNPLTGLVLGENFTYDGGGNEVSAQYGAKIWNYSFDSLNELTGSQGGNNAPGTFYNYDGAGNRTNVVGLTGSGSYTFDLGPDLQMNQCTTNPFGSNTYDPAGDLIETVSLETGTRQMSYDYIHRLVAFTNIETGQGATFKYDCLGRRVEKDSFLGDTRYYYNGYNVVQEELSNGATNTYAYGSGIIEETLDDTPYFPLFDNQGSARAVTDIEGSVAETYEYGDYGTVSIFDSGGMPLTNSANRQSIPFSIAMLRSGDSPKLDGSPVLELASGRVYRA
jgi:YD repeat-containing protein